ncbi:MAG: glycoside hydrolase [Verrucomicrobia bacterium]|nr:glycoside hydrolase [Verrucomicrobiota bacterium]
MLDPAAFAPHVGRFNTMEPETVVNVVPNSAAWDWLRAQVPLFTCPDRDFEETYFFRWWSLRKHLIKTPAGGHAFTEFLQRSDPISSAVGHHVMETRWLRDSRFTDDYARHWLRGGPDGALHPAFHNFSEWLAHALYSRWLVNRDTAFLTGRLDDLVRNYAQWDTERLTSGGLYWQYDVRDAMEESISGARTKQNLRPPLNSYQFGNAIAIAAIARLAGRGELAREFEARAATLRRLVEDRLWDDRARFFKVRLEDGLPDAPRARRRDPAFTVPPEKLHATLSDAREQIGFIPWYFSLPTPGRGYEAAWAQFTDEAGFRAPFGLTTAERRHPQFRTHGTGTCEWDGAVWPYATSQTLTALANALRDYPAVPVTSRDWFDALVTFARSHRAPDGKPYLGEYLDEKTGAWIKVRNPERSRYYHHSTFADLVITGLAGLRPRADDTIELAPLLPAGTWDWFCLDGVRYHGRTLTIVWDRTGEKFNRGTGLTLLVDDRPVARAESLTRLTARIP